MAKELEVSSVIDRGQLGRFRKLVIGLCAGVVFLDGFDAQAIGFVAPSLIEDWDLPRHELGPVFAAGLIGLMLGALLIAPLADRLGRRPIILISTIIFGVFSLATAAADSINDLLILRFLTGLGLGGCMPNAIALTSEYSPQRNRSLLVMIMFSGFTLGSICGGLVSAQLIPLWGWRAVFIVGGVLPLLYAPLLFLLLPESIRLLVAKGAPGSRIGALLRKVEPALEIRDDTRYLIDEAPVRKSAVDLFQDGRGLRTALLWIIFFMSLLDVYMLVNWLPTAINATGASVQTSIMMGIILQVGGILGVIPLGWLLDRFGPRSTLFPAYLIAAVSIACIGLFASSSMPLTALVVFGAGLGVIGGQTAGNAIAAASYPTQLRSTGVGWALGVGRVGSIVGPALAGVLISIEVSTRDIFLLSAIPAAIAALAALALGGIDRTARLSGLEAETKAA